MDIVIEKTATFIGHKECWDVDLEKLRTAIALLIEKNGVTNFLCGGMGGFDLLCAEYVYRLKSVYPHIRSVLVIPYLSFQTGKSGKFDEVLYPQGFERYNFKAAIPKRNRFLVENAAYAVCYVRHGWGGAAKTYELAKKRKLKIVDGRFTGQFARNIGHTQTAALIIKAAEIK